MIRKPRFRLGITALGATVVVVVIAFLMVSSLRRPAVVYVGPVELGVGLPGVVDKRMTRKQVLKVVGPPLRVRETIEEAEARGSSHTDPDYFAGIYAEAYWDNTDKAVALDFDLDDFARRFGSDLRVLVRCNGGTRLLSRSLTLREARKSGFAENLGFGKSQVKLNGDTLFFVSPSGSTTLMSLDFTEGRDGRLREIYIGW